MVFLRDQHLQGQHSGIMFDIQTVDCSMTWQHVIARVTLVSAMTELPIPRQYYRHIVVNPSQAAH